MDVKNEDVETTQNRVNTIILQGAIIYALIRNNAYKRRIVVKEEKC